MLHTVTGSGTEQHGPEIAFKAEANGQQRQAIQQKTIQHTEKQSHGIARRKGVNKGIRTAFVEDDHAGTAKQTKRKHFFSGQFHRDNINGDKEGRKITKRAPDIGQIH